jgi:hypothetical protein
VRPSLQGEPFRLVSEPLAAPRWQANDLMQVDLVNGGEVWYRWTARPTWQGASSTETRGD